VGFLLALLILGALAVALFFLAKGLVGGAKTVTVPNVKGKSIQTARFELRQTNLLPNVTPKASNQPKDQVLSQNPSPGTKVKENSIVNLVVSAGPQTVTVPDITGKTEDQAARILKGAKLKLGQKFGDEASDTVPKGQIIRQIPAAGTNQPAGTEINYILSTGPQQVAVPNVICQPKGQAREAIRTRGLVPQNGGQASSPNLNCPQPNSVASTNPDPGTLVDPGTTVTYFTSFAPTPTTPSPSSG